MRYLERCGGNHDNGRVRASRGFPRGFMGLLQAGLVSAVVLLTGCATAVGGPGSGAAQPGAAINPHYKVGNPYQIGNQWYYPAVDKRYEEIGIASWYGPNFHGKPTANGELFDRNAMTAAHRTLPLPSIVEVKNLDNGRTVRVRVNDRGPFAKDRIIDLSEAAARRLGFIEQGTARVEVRYLKEASLELALLRLNDRRAMRALERELEQSRKGARRTSLREGRNHRAGRGRTSPGDISDLIVENAFSAPGASPGAAPLIAPGARGPITPERNPSGGPEAGRFGIIPERAVNARPPTRERYEIQVGAFVDLNRAQTAALRLSASGPVFMQSINLPQGGLVHKVLMGPYRASGEADRQLGALQRAGYGDAWIIRITSW